MPLSPPAMQKGLSVINHLLIYLIKQGPAACRHLSLVVVLLVVVGRGGQVYSALSLHWAAAGGAHLKVKDGGKVARLKNKDGDKGK